MVFKGEFTTINIEKSKDVTNIELSSFGKKVCFPLPKNIKETIINNGLDFEMKDFTNNDRTIYLINMRTKEKQIDINIVNNKVKGSIDAITLTYEDYNTFLNAL